MRPPAFFVASYIVQEIPFFLASTAALNPAKTGPDNMKMFNHDASGIP